MADLLAQLERWRRTVVSDEVDADWLEAVHGACNDLAAACAMKLEQSRLLRLPSELLLHVLRYCDAADLAALDSTAKAFHSQLSIVDLAIAGATEHAHGKLVTGSRAWLQEICTESSSSSRMRDAIATTGRRGQSSRRPRSTEPEPLPTPILRTCPRALS